MREQVRARVVFVCVLVGKTRVRRTEHQLVVTQTRARAVLGPHTALFGDDFRRRVVRARNVRAGGFPHRRLL